MPTTETLAGMHLTGRRVAGPGSDLVELESEDGVLHTAIVLDEKFRGMSQIVQAVELAQGFMEFPMVTGLVEMSSYLPDEGALIYPTGNTRSVAEVIKHYRESKARFSKRAALELLYLSGQVLQEAAETGPLQGVYSHSDLNPARLLVREDGDVQVIGYGLPSPEVLGWVSGAKVDPHPESLYYTPPERLQGAPEDVTSDLYSLACIAVELITGSPLFVGSVEELKSAHLNGKGPQLVSKLKKQVGAPIVDILQYCLNFDPHNRYDDGHAFVSAIGELLEGVAGGESLEEAVKVVHARKAGRTLRSAGATSATPRAGVAGPARGRSIRPPTRPQAGQEPESEGRWGKVSRGHKEEEEEKAEEEEASASRRRRRRRRTTEEEPAKEEVSTSSRRRHHAAEEEEDESSSRRRRRRRSTDEEPEEEAAEEAAEEEESASRRRRRRRSSEAEKPEAKEEPEEEAPSRRRSRRSAASKDEDEDEEETPSRRRSRRSSASKEDEKDEEETPSRRRSRRSSASEDEEEEETPARRRSRRSSASKDEEEEETPARRRSRRSSASKDEEEEEAAASSTRRRRRRRSDDEDGDDEDDSKDDKPSSRRRTRRRTTKKKK